MPARPDNPLDRIRWLIANNTTNVNIPASSLALVTDTDDTGVVQLVQPDTNSQDPTLLVATGPFTIPPGSMGICSRDWPLPVSINTSDAPPANGDSGGAQAGDWNLRDGQTGFTCFGPTSPVNTVMVAPAFTAPPPATGAAYAALATAGIGPRSGTTPGVANCVVYEIIAGVLTNQHFDETVYNLFPVSIPTGQYIPIVLDEFGDWLAASPTEAGVFDLTVECSGGASYPNINTIEMNCTDLSVTNAGAGAVLIDTVGDSGTFFSDYNCAFNPNTCVFSKNTFTITVVNGLIKNISSD